MLNRTRIVAVESMEKRTFLDASLLTETIVSDTLPSTISDQAVLKGVVTVDIANNSGVDENEKVATGIEISNGPLVPLSGQFGILSNKTMKLVLKSGQDKTIKFAVSIAKGKLADGVDTVTALTSNQDSQYTQSDAGPSLTVHAPIVTLSETESFTKLTDTVATGEKVKPAAKVVITNTGTDPSTTALVIGVYATADGVASDGTGITVLPARKYTINPGKSVTVSVPLAGVPKLAAGTYTILSQVTQSNGTVTTSDPGSAPSVTITAPTTGPVFADTIISASGEYNPDYLDGAFQTITKLDLSMSIVNSGATTSGSDTLLLFASTSSTFDSSAVQVGDISLDLGTIPGNGGKRTFDAQFGVGENFPSVPDSDGNTNDYIFVQIKDAAGDVSMASYPTAVNFAGPIVG